MYFHLSRDPLARVLVISLAIGACAPAAGALLDGGEGEIELEDSELDATARMEEDDCEADGDETVCTYEIDVTIQGQTYWKGQADLIYNADGTIVLDSVSDERYPEPWTDLDATLVPDGEDDDVATELGDYTVELKEESEEWEDHAGCRVYRYTNPSDEVADATICDGLGLVRVELGGADFERDDPGGCSSAPGGPGLLLALGGLLAVRRRR